MGEQENPNVETQEEIKMQQEEAKEEEVKPDKKKSAKY